MASDRALDAIDLDAMEREYYERGNYADVLDVIDYARRLLADNERLTEEWETAETALRLVGQDCQKMEADNERLRAAAKVTVARLTDEAEFADTEELHDSMVDLAEGLAAALTQGDPE